MRTCKSIIFGVLLVIFGVILGINSLGLINFDIFFDGWWTLFIIIPSLIGIFTDKDKTGSIIFLLIGVLLLLECQDIIESSLIAKLFLPMVIVIIGLSLIFKNVFNTGINKSIEKINSTSNSKEEYNAIFSGQNINLDGEFTGTSLNAVFGGIKLDLRKANIKKDVVISGRAIFGGIDIYVPDNVEVQIKSNSIFGGVDNKNKSDNKDITVYIDATCIFGGIDIK